LLSVLLAAGCDGAAGVRVPQAASRDSFRAYYGAPPVIPHAVRELGRSNCLACHVDGLAPVEGPVAVPKPHATLGDCLQCHVEQQRDARLFAETQFIGLAEPRGRHAAYSGAPPVIPHRLWLRENCPSCHGPRGHPTLRTTHPERTNCTQCHVPQEPNTEPLIENRFAQKGGAAS
jgi:cytochrome c-type protein NapB